MYTSIETVLEKIQNRETPQYKDCMLLSRMRETEQHPVHHQEGNVYIHSALAYENMLQYSRNETPEDQLTLNLAALYHDVGKIERSKLHPDGRITNHGHDRRGAEIWLRYAHTGKNLKLLGQKRIWQVHALIQNHMWYHLGDRITLHESLRNSIRINPLWLQKLWEADTEGRTCQDKEKLRYMRELSWERIKELGVHTSNPVEVLLKRKELLHTLNPHSKQQFLYNLLTYENVEKAAYKVMHREEPKGTVVWMWGVNGSGKSTVAAQWSKDLGYEILASSTGGTVTQQKKQIGMNRARIRKMFSSETSFIVDAKHLTETSRRRLVALCELYNYRSWNVSVHSDTETIYERLKHGREKTGLEFERAEEVEAFEASSITHVNSF